MSIFRKRYRVDVLRTSDCTLQALIRIRQGLASARIDLSACGWCPHIVKARTPYDAERQALAAHVSQCEKLTVLPHGNGLTTDPGVPYRRQRGGR